MDKSTLGRIVRNGKKYQQKNIPDFNNLIYTYNFLILTLTLSEARNLTCVYVNLIQTRVRSIYFWFTSAESVSKRSYGSYDNIYDISGLRQERE